MAKYESEKSRASKVTRSANPRIAAQAARKYVNEGINDLGIKPQDKAALRAKLVPIVARQIGAERGRSSVRAEAAVVKSAAKKVKSATKKIIG